MCCLSPWTEHWCFKLALRTLEGVLTTDSEESSRGNRCCTGLLRKFLADHNFMALSTPSLPGYSSLTMPSGPLPQFFTSDIINYHHISNSQSVGLPRMPIRLCFSLRLQRSSYDHLFRIASLQLR